MQYIVDGHNLIPLLGLRLDSPDDELELIRRLQEFCRLRRAQVEVYFDGAPPGMAGSRSFGSVNAHFIQQRVIADAAIEKRLGASRKTARNWVVVSSDRRVQAAARAVHAAVLSSAEFAALISSAMAEASLQAHTDPTLSPGEVDEWLRTFRGRD